MYLNYYYLWKNVVDNLNDWWIINFETSFTRESNEFSSSTCFCRSLLERLSNFCSFGVTDGITTASLMRFQANPGFGFIKTKEGRTIPRPNAVYAGNLIHSEYNHETQKFEATH